MMAATKSKKTVATTHEAKLVLPRRLGLDLYGSNMEINQELIDGLRIAERKVKLQ